MKTKNFLKRSKAFSLVEIIIVISIVALLAIVGASIAANKNDKTRNSKVLADIETIKSAVTASNMAGNGDVILPEGNKNYFSESGTYVHFDKGSSNYDNVYGVYGQFTDNLLSNQYLNATPIDPRTNQFYAYGVILRPVDGLSSVGGEVEKNHEFEVAGIVKDNDTYKARVVGNYQALHGIYSLIREYNGPNFVIDRRETLPYNPENKILVVTDQNGKIYHEGDIIGPTSGTLEIYFSDGSVSMLESGTTVRFDDLKFPKENGLITQVKLFLSAGAIWTKATQLGDGSSFQIQAGDITASVRGTIFKVYADGRVEVMAGKVEVIPNGESQGEIREGNNEFSSDIPDFILPNYELTPVNYGDLDEDKLYAEYCEKKGEEYDKERGCSSEWVTIDDEPDKEEPKDGMCGDSDGKNFLDLLETNSDLCGGEATLKYDSFTFTNTNNKWTWVCEGKNGGKDKSCSAEKVTYACTGGDKPEKNVLTFNEYGLENSTEWQNTNSDGECYWKCNTGYDGDDCNSCASGYSKNNNVCGLNCNEQNKDSYSLSITNNGSSFESTKEVYSPSEKRNEKYKNTFICNNGNFTTSNNTEELIEYTYTGLLIGDIVKVNFTNIEIGIDSNSIQTVSNAQYILFKDNSKRLFIKSNTRDILKNNDTTNLSFTNGKISFSDNNWQNTDFTFGKNTNVSNLELKNFSNVINYIKISK